MDGGGGLAAANDVAIKCVDDGDYAAHFAQRQRINFNSAQRPSSPSLLSLSAHHTGRERRGRVGLSGVGVFCN